MPPANAEDEVAYKKWLEHLDQSPLAAIIVLGHGLLSGWPVLWEGPLSLDSDFYVTCQRQLSKTTAGVVPPFDGDFYCRVLSGLAIRTWWPGAVAGFHFMPWTDLPQDMKPILCAHLRTLLGRHCVVVVDGPKHLYLATDSCKVLQDLVAHSSAGSLFSDHSKNSKKPRADYAQHRNMVTEDPTKIWTTQPANRPFSVPSFAFLESQQTSPWPVNHYPHHF